MSLVNNLIVRLRSTNRRKQNSEQRPSIRRKSPPQSRRQSRVIVDYPAPLPDHDDESSFHEPFPSVPARAYREYYNKRSEKDTKKSSTLNSSLSRHASTSSHASPSSSSDHDHTQSLSSCYSATPALEHHRARSFSVSSVFFIRTRPSRRSRSLSAGRRPILNEDMFNPYQYPPASVSLTGSLGTCTSTATTTSSNVNSSTTTFPVAASPVTPLDSPLVITPSGTRPVARRSLVNRKRPPLSMIIEDNLDPNKQESKEKSIDGFWTVSITGEKVKKRAEGDKKLQKRGRTRLHVTNSPSLANLLPGIPHASRSGLGQDQGINAEEAVSDEESGTHILPPGLLQTIFLEESLQTPITSPPLPFRHPARRSLNLGTPDCIAISGTERESRPPSAWKDNSAVRRSIDRVDITADDQQDGGDDVDDTASFMTATSQLSS